MFQRITLSIVVTTMLCSFAAAHPGHSHHHNGDASKSDADKAPVKFVSFQKKLDVDGQGSWKFRYRPDLSQVPVEEKFLLEAHGGFAVDRSLPEDKRQTYFGLPGVGVLKVSPDLTKITVVGGDKGLFKEGETRPRHMWNYHNTAIVKNAGSTYLGFPGNNSGNVWITNLDGNIVTTLKKPSHATGWAPTDLTQMPLNGEVIKVTSGYGDRFIYEADAFGGDDGKGIWNPGRFGGKGPRTEAGGVYSTSHGISLVPGGEFLAISDRENGRIQINTSNGRVLNMWDLMPEGTTVGQKKWPHPCDVDFSPDGRYAVIGNLRDPMRAAATFMIWDVLEGKLLSTVCPKDLGVPNSTHIHYAGFRFVKTNGQIKIYVLALFWRPGGYAVFECVGEPV